VTIAEFENLPDPPSGHYELHHGELILMPPRIKQHMQIQQVLYDLLSPTLSGLGFLTIEFAFRPAPEYESWQADLAWVSQARWEADQNQYFLGAPDFVIEVLSAGNTVDEMLDRQEVCFNNGCEEFWTVDPKRRTVLVTAADRKTVTYSQSMNIPVPYTEKLIEVGRVFSLY